MQSQVKRRIVFGLTTGGLLATGGVGFAHADASSAGAGDAGTTTAGSPGILSGNTIQVPVDIPINVCGVTANVIGLLNPAVGNHCGNEGGASAGGVQGASGGTGGATANGSSVGSPGILSGNTVQAPVHVPVNVCGDSVNVVGVGNDANGNHCHNGGGAGTGGSTATGSSVGSPGIISGNTVQVPVDVPVNVCGDTVNVVGVGNDAKGNHCHNSGGTSAGGSTATGSSVGSPGIISGNTIQLPIDVPVNLCGDTVNVVGVGDDAKGNACANNTPPSTPPTTTTPPPTVSTGGHVVPHNIVLPETPTATPASPATPAGMLAHTGADSLMLAPIGAALVGGGAFMYRKYKPGRAH